MSTCAIMAIHKNNGGKVQDVFDYFSQFKTEHGIVDDITISKNKKSVIILYTGRYRNMPLVSDMISGLAHLADGIVVQASYENDHYQNSTFYVSKDGGWGYHVRTKKKVNVLKNPKKSSNVIDRQNNANSEVVDFYEDIMRDYTCNNQKAQLTTFNNEEDVH